MSNKIKIITNNHKYQLVTFFDLSERVRREFDYVKEEDKHSPMFVKYRNWYYDISEFMRIPFFECECDHPFHKWDGYRSDSFFSGVLVKWSEDFETVKMGTYYS
jgi:hypothetical protein